MTLTPDLFRAALPEFGDNTKYTDPQIQANLTLAVNFINEERWGPMATLGANLVTAHFLVLSFRELRAASTGQLPGEVKGLVTAKSVGDVSVSHDLSAVTLDGESHWNSTSYGIRYRQLARMAGAGGLQLPGCSPGGSPFGFGGFGGLL